MRTWSATGARCLLGSSARRRKRPILQRTDHFTMRLSVDTSSWCRCEQARVNVDRARCRVRPRSTLFGDETNDWVDVLLANGAASMNAERRRDTFRRGTLTSLSPNVAFISRRRAEIPTDNTDRRIVRPSEPPAIPEIRARPRARARIASILPRRARLRPAGTARGGRLLRAAPPTRSSASERGGD